MCGRYVAVSSVQSIEKRFNVQANPEVISAWKPNANVSHGEKAPVITSDAPQKLEMQQFGFTPRWAKKQFYMINARSEGDQNKGDDPRYLGAMGIIQKPMFRQSIRDRRCLIIADAVIEGPKQDKLTKPYLVYPRNSANLFALAGIWDEWLNPQTGEIIRSFAILTTVANSLLQTIGHHRSPVLLQEENEHAWLDLSTPLADITAMLRPFPSNTFNAYPISPRIRDPRVNGSELLLPIGPRIHTDHVFMLHQEIEPFGTSKADMPTDSSGRQGGLFS